MSYILISLLRMSFIIIDVFEFGIACPTNNLLYLYCSICPLNIFLGKLWVIILNRFHHDVVINCVFKFTQII